MSQPENKTDLYKGVESFDGHLHVIPTHQSKDGVRVHEPDHLCWCEPEFQGKKDDGTEIWYHRRVH